MVIKKLRATMNMTICDVVSFSSGSKTLSKMSCFGGDVDINNYLNIQ